MADMNDRKNGIEAWLERLLFAGRWIMAPIYVGLLVILAVVAIKFVEELIVAMPLVLSMQERDLVLFVLSLVDLALLGSLVLMVSFAGYENFVSKMHSVTGHEDRPDWMGHIDLSGLKLKLISSRSLTLHNSRKKTWRGSWRSILGLSFPDCCWPGWIA